MAKSKFERLLEIIEAATKIKDEAIVGDEAEQYTQESLNKLSQAIVTAHEIHAVTDSEPAVYDEASTSLTEAVKAFKDSVNKDVTKETNEKQNGHTPENTQLEKKYETVTLKGWESERKGNHSIHLKNRIISFVNGKSEVSTTIAQELREAGCIE